MFIQVNFGLRPSKGKSCPWCLFRFPKRNHLISTLFFLVLATCARKRTANSAAAVRSKLAKRTTSRLSIDALLHQPDFIKEFRDIWSLPDTFVESKDWPTVSLRKRPFTIGLISRFLRTPTVIPDLLEEILELKFTRKRMDLYEFYQSPDLSNIETPLLAQFHYQMTHTVKPLMEELTGRRLTHISSSCSMYNCGDRLLVHDDRLGDRIVAYVFYLSPWPGADRWTPEMGGALELFNCDENGDPTYPIADSVPPKNNQFVFFKVGEKSFHQVGEVTSLNYPRITINGWFHGPALKNDPIPEPKHRAEVLIPRLFPPVDDNIILGEWINENYLNHKVKQSIHEHIEQKSEASLQEFLVPDYFEFLKEQFITNTDNRWTHAGPANRRNLDLLQLNTARGPIRDLIALLKSANFFHLLHEYTELDLSGSKMRSPTCTIEISRLGANSYSMLDDSLTQLEDTLDLILYFNTNENTSPAGTFSYLNASLDTSNTDAEETENACEDTEDDGAVAAAPGFGGTQPNMGSAQGADQDSSYDDDSDDDDDDGPFAPTKKESEDETSIHTEETSVLLSVAPRDNALNLVYRCRGTAKFLHYVSKRTMRPDESIIVVVASYRE